MRGKRTDVTQPDSQKRRQAFATAIGCSSCPVCRHVDPSSVLWIMKRVTCMRAQNGDQCNTSTSHICSPQNLAVTVGSALLRSRVTSRPTIWSAASPRVFNTPQEC